MITVLGIESSCDETAACVLQVSSNNHVEVLANDVASQHEIHRPHGGIVPELASRQHLQVLAPMVKATLKESGLEAHQLDGVVATTRPGLLGSLLVGLCFAKSFAWGLKKPFIGVSHLEGHLNAPFLEHPDISYPHLALLVSGGHTVLYRCQAFAEYELIGATRDDAAGEAFDKVAKMLDLGYPGGPIVDRLAKEGDPGAHDFPRSQVRGHPLDFSFSGVKTAVRYYIEKTGFPPLSKGRVREGSLLTSPQSPPSQGGEAAIANICASFQEAVVDSLIEKTLKAAREYGDKTVLLTGGVACNSRLRSKLSAACETEGIECVMSSPKYCTDNAAMIAYVGAKRLAHGETSPWDLNANPTEMLKGPPPG